MSINLRGRTPGTLETQYTPSGLEEGDQIELALTMAPELYVDAASCGLGCPGGGRIHGDAHGH